MLLVFGKYLKLLLVKTQVNDFFQKMGKKDTKQCFVFVWMDWIFISSFHVNYLLTLEFI